jgi:hypothetical protein
MGFHSRAHYLSLGSLGVREEWKRMRVGMRVVASVPAMVAVVEDACAKNSGREAEVLVASGTLSGRRTVWAKGDAPVTA